LNTLITQPVLDSEFHESRLPVFDSSLLGGCSSAHLVGIAGSGMKALAELLAGMRWSVSGSEKSTNSPSLQILAQRGIRVHKGHSENYLPNDVDVLIYSSAIGPVNSERQAAAKRGVPQFSLSEFIGELMRDRVGVSVAGTHGKSTTTSLIAWILRHSGQSPSAIIGAELCNDDQNGWAGSGELFVVESCEYQKNFLNLAPNHAVILGIEPDHFDCFDKLEESISAFEEFAGLLPSTGQLLLNGDCPNFERARSASDATVETFSLEPGSDWWATDCRFIPEGTRFRVFHREQFVMEVSLPIPGRHNVQNALAAIAMCSTLGVSAHDLREAIHDYPGIRRRYQRNGFWRGAVLIDDYAHHPTAISLTLQTVRQEYPNRRVICAFQPHQVLRTERLMTEFSAAFTEANDVLVVPVFAARETMDEQTVNTSKELAAGISRNGTPARFLPSLDQLVTTLEDESRPGDVVITMGAGDIDRVQHEFTRRVQRDYAA
jgi:UDP-N-acetylmuramate--alanine ligase